MPKINFIELKFFLKRIIAFLQKRIFWTPFCLLIALLIYAGFLFYYYVLIVPEITEQMSDEGTQLKTELYWTVAERLDQREKILENELKKEYNDIFR